MAKILLIFVCLVAALNLVSSQKVKFSKCDEGKTEGNLTELDVIPCPSQPCELHPGTTETLKAHFKLFKNVSDAYSSVHAKVAGFWVPFPLPNPHACKDSGLKCPLQAGESYIYVAKLPVKSEYPHLSTVVKWELKDKSKEPEVDIFCFELSVKID